MSDASVTLDLDAREFDARLAAVEQKAVSSSRNIGSGFGTAASLRTHLARNLATAATAYRTHFARP